MGRCASCFEAAMPRALWGAVWRAQSTAGLMGQRYGIATLLWDIEGCGYHQNERANEHGGKKQEAHMQTVVEVLQSIKASDMTPMLQRIYQSPGGSELLDVLMKYLYVSPAGW
jgi:hypothetical protein